MKQAIALAVLTLATLTAGQASADEAAGVVTSLGCHNVNDICYVTLDGYPTSAYCNKSGQLRWDAGTSWGKKWYSLFLTAQLTGRRVSLFVPSDACSDQNFPTFYFGTLL